MLILGVAASLAWIFFFLLLGVGRGLRVLIVAVTAGFLVYAYVVVRIDHSFRVSAIASAPPGFAYSFVDNPNNTNIDLVVSIPEPAMASFFPIIALALLLRRRREELPARAN
jgi:hypothetical protein